MDTTCGTGSRIVTSNANRTFVDEHFGAASDLGLHDIGDPPTHLVRRGEQRAAQHDACRLDLPAAQGERSGGRDEPRGTVPELDGVGVFCGHRDRVGSCALHPERHQQAPPLSRGTQRGVRAE